MSLTFCIAAFVAANDSFTERGSWSGIYVLIDLYDLLTKSSQIRCSHPSKCLPQRDKVFLCLRGTSSGDQGPITYQQPFLLEDTPTNSLPGWCEQSCQRLSPASRDKRQGLDGQDIIR